MTVRQDFINHLKLRELSQYTIDNYVDNAAQLSRDYNKSLDNLNHENIIKYLMFFT